jgi:hypothetical protein
MIMVVFYKGIKLEIVRETADESMIVWPGIWGYHQGN